jgi:hypothetical protein
MKTTVTGIRRYGPHWLVRLACGHNYTLTPGKLKEPQLYVNKAIDCQQHASEDNPITNTK